MIKHKANPDDFNIKEDLRRQCINELRVKEEQRYRRDMRIVNGVMIFCAVALVVLLAIQTLS